MNLPRDLLPLIDPRARIRLLRAIRAHDVDDSLIEWARTMSPGLFIRRGLVALESALSAHFMKNVVLPATGVTLVNEMGRIQILVSMGPWFKAACRVCKRPVRQQRLRTCLFLGAPCHVHCMASVVECYSYDHWLRILVGCAEIGLAETEAGQTIGVITY